MKRPTLIILIYYLAGILTGRYLTEAGIVPFVIMLMLAIVLFFVKRERFCLAAPVFMVIGAISISVMLSNGGFAEGEVIREGVIKNITYSQNGTQRLDIETDENICIRVMADKNYAVGIGDVIAVKGTAVMPEKPTNPGEFDDYTYMKREGLSYRVYAETIYKTGEKPMPISSAFYNARKKLNKSIDRIYTKDNAAIVKAIVTGDKSYISDSLRTLYTDGGVVHILCISGLHVSIIAGLVIWLFRKWFGKTKSTIAAAAVLFVYMAFIGFSPSVTRAVIMAVIGFAAADFGRKSDALNNLLIAALAILLANPLLLFSSGFLLSFVTVLGVILSMLFYKDDKKSGYIKKTIITSFFATAFSLPITAYYFYNVSLAGIITNLVVLPLTPVIVIFGIISAVVGISSEVLGTFFAGSVAAVLWFYEAVLEVVTKIDFLNVITGRPNIVFCIAYYSVLIVVMTNIKNRISAKIICIMATTAMVFMLVSGRTFYESTEIAFLDVGQGDCAVITDKDGGTFVIDTGGSWFYDEDDGTGKRYVYPYLQYKGRSSIDVLFISHPDSDHAQGSLGLMEMIDVEKIVFANYDYEESELYDKIIETAEKTDTEIEFVSAGDKMTFGDLDFECLYPFEGSGGETNAGSMVIKLIYGDFSVLFTGDVGFREEIEMINNGVDLSADVLKVAHHGSKYSTADYFVSEVGCKCAVISVGANNNYGHPSEEVLETLSDVNVYETDNYGAVIISTDGEDYKIRTMK